jgi:hypothetical protein
MSTVKGKNAVLVVTANASNAKTVDSIKNVASIWLYVISLLALIASDVFFVRVVIAFTVKLRIHFSNASE